MEGMVRCGANYVPLSPINFLERSALVYRDRPSIVYGHLRFTWKETHRRCLRLASALTHFGIAPGDVVAVLAPNIPAMYELHFAVPMAGGVLCTLNIRHDSAMVSVLLGHSEAKMIFVDYELLDIARGALKLLAEKKAKLPIIIVIADSTTSKYIAKDILEYEDMLKTGMSEYEVRWPKDELDPITLNYTSGTTSSPKGVIYSHRGTFLNALAVIILNEMGSAPVYLWTVPMFHCNGWSFTWAIAAQGGTNVCLRSVIAKDIFEAIALHKVTDLSGAPTVLNMIANAPDIHKKPLPGKVRITVAGAPPPPQILLSVENLGFDVTHSYGLTETYGPATVCVWQPEWDALPDEERVKIKSRQGLQHITMAQVDVKDPVTMKSVPSDAQTIGEVMFKGSTVMSGYLKNVKATDEAFAGGWFRTGDLGVKHLDGYIQLKDRSKDIIISGGENVSSIEVEAVLFNHPAILEAAVVSRPDTHWGETVCAFVKLKQNHETNAEDIIRFCRSRMPHYMCPKTVIFEDLPKTSTGKTQKFILKKKAEALGSLTRKIGSKL